ncbi:MAG: ABC transporter ATP-binding protein [Clostridia bacterium]|nr:ABC transporter ATP-binding protein [Clostridia bacterium]
MIEIKNVSKEFTKKNEKGKSVKFLADKDISFEVHDGEILGLLGPNGAGKTTLLRMIAGIMKPTTGQIQIDNTTYDKDEIAIKKNISFLSGNTKLYKDISCVELLKMCAGYYGMDKSIVSNRIDEVIARFDMESFKNQRIGSLSTGQVQRLGVSRCVLHDPHYYVLDEATSGLDIISSQIILDFIKEERDKGKCIIYSTHYMEEAENICDRVVLLNKGKKIAEGTPEEVVKQTDTSNIRDAFFKLIGDSRNELE